MRYIKNLYHDASLNEEKINEIIVGLECGEYPAYYYIASFNEHDSYLEILSYRGLKVEIQLGNNPIIIGVATSENKARDLVIMIIEEQLSLHSGLDKSDLIREAR